MNRFGSVDGVLVQWGDRLFYLGNRIVHAKGDLRLRSGAAAQRASALRARIEATMVRRAPQVMVKVTGGGRGMAAIAAHLRYISKNGRLDIEDDRGQSVRGKDAIRDLVDEWRFGGSLIEDVSPRREAFNIMLSMPRGSQTVGVGSIRGRVIFIVGAKHSPNSFAAMASTRKRPARLRAGQHETTTQSGAPKPGRRIASGASVLGRNLALQRSLHARRHKRPGNTSPRLWLGQRTPVIERSLLPLTGRSPSSSESPSAATSPEWIAKYGASDLHRLVRRGYRMSEHTPSRHDPRPAWTSVLSSVDVFRRGSMNVCCRHL